MKQFAIFSLILAAFLPLTALAKEASVLKVTSGTNNNEYVLVSCALEECTKIVTYLNQMETNQTLVCTAPVVEAEDEIVELSYAPKAVLINEIVAVPTVGEKEWVEVYNATNQPINLTNWELEEGSGKITELFGTIGSGGYLVFDKSYLNNDGDIIILRDPLGNIIDSISYGSWNDGNTSDNAPTVAVGNSLINWNGVFKETTTITSGQVNVYTPIVVEETVATNNNQPPITPPEADPSSSGNNQSTQEETETVTNYDFSSLIRINEFLANPATDTNAEWIELYNGDSRAINLKGWTLDDLNAGGSAPYKIASDLIVGSGQYLVLAKQQTGLALNNDADQVNLFDSSGALLSNVSYKTAQKGVSNSLIDDEWQETANLTPGAENVGDIVEDEEQIAVVEDTIDSALAEASGETASLSVSSVIATKKSTTSTAVVESPTYAGLKAFPLKTKVSLTGQVIVLPKIFSKNTVILSNGEEGIELYFSKADWPELQIGDAVKVVGTIGESSGKRRVLVKEKTDIFVIENSEIVEPREISSPDVGETLLDNFVSITAKLVAKEKNKFVLADEEGEFNVYLKTGAKIDSKLYTEGDQLKMRGIIGAVNNEIYLMPRGAEDIEDLTWAENQIAGTVAPKSSSISANNQPQKIIWALIIFFVLSGATSVYLFRNKLREKLQNFRRIPVAQFSPFPDKAKFE